MPRDLPDFARLANDAADAWEAGDVRVDAYDHAVRFGYIAGLRRAFAIAEKAGGGSESVQWALEAIHEAIATLEDDHAA